ncbi:MAG TPA: hypothetical protein DIC32_10165 [Acinetobacter radioresistens]|uniref:Uncharacterized protein n=1 Tax=Acinetobacter radioresistens TaxID=40216 RepID=A0A3D3G1B3_ACIRA|nr:hypothetical protein [Acinetobacter radioresistens]
MPKIPMGSFGNAMPQVERIHMPQNQSGQMISGALQNVSQVAGQYAEKQKAEQEKRDNLTASTVVSQFSLDAENMAAR